MGKYACMICDDTVAARAINELIAERMTGAAISRLMTLRGFKVSAETVNSHRPHNVIVAPAGIVKRQRDVAILAADKVADLLEQADVDILDRSVQGAIKTGLGAQKILDTRAARSDDKKLAFTLSLILAGGSPAGFLAPPELIGEDDGIEDDDDIIEGEAVVVE